MHFCDCKRGRYVAVCDSILGEREEKVLPNSKNSAATYNGSLDWTAVVRHNASNQDITVRGIGVCAATKGSSNYQSTRTLTTSDTLGPFVRIYPGMPTGIIVQMLRRCDNWRTVVLWTEVCTLFLQLFFYL